MLHLVVRPLVALKGDEMKDWYKDLVLTVIAVVSVALFVLGFCLLIAWAARHTSQINCADYSKSYYDAGTVPIRCYEEGRG